MRSGRIRVAAKANKIIIHAGTGSAVRYYRVFHSGRNKTEKFTIEGLDNATKKITLEHSESIDFAVKNKDISITAGADAVEVVLDFLG